MASIIVSNLTKEYRLKNQTKTALSGVSFSIAEGEAVGIIGRNGSGKSTLLKILAGITAATKGTVQVTGKVGALLELGAGFHPEYTGIQNIYLNGAIHGKSKGQVREKLPEILDFAGIGDFAKQKVKTYSSGMFLRLAFASAIAFQPEILLIDEALSVGDVLFQAKCLQKLKDLKDQGTTLLYVSHDIDAVRRFCTRALWLEAGKLRLDGPVAEVTSGYLAAAIGQESSGSAGRFGSHQGAIRSVTASGIWEHGKEVSVTVRVCPPEPAEGINLSVSVKTPEGLDLLVLSSKESGVFLSGGREEAVTFRFPSPFCGGNLVLAAGLEIPGSNPIRYYDYWDAALEIRGGKTPYFGVFHVPVEVETDEEGKSQH